MKNLVLALLTVISFPCCAQVIPLWFPDTVSYFGPGPSVTVVRMDPMTRAPIGDLPFDRGFIMRFYFNETDSAVRVFYINERGKEPKGHVILPGGILPKGCASYSDDKYLTSLRAQDVYIPALNPNTAYQIDILKTNEELMANNYAVFRMIYNNDMEGAKKEAMTRAERNPFQAGFDVLCRYYNDHQIGAVFRLASAPEIEDRIRSVQLRYPFGREIRNGKSEDVAISVRDVTGSEDHQVLTQQGDIEVSAPLQLVADAGLVMAGFQKGFASLVPYVGLSLSLRPYDSKIPFRRIKRRLSAIPDRLAVNLGITVNSLSKEGYRTNLFGSYNLLFGLSYKFSHVISFTGGTLFYYNADPNPLLDRKTLGVAPYAGISISLKIKNALGEIAKIFSYGK